MNLSDSGPSIDLTPIIPESLTFSLWTDSIRILWWVFYRPRMLIAYIHNRKSANRDLDLSNLRYAATAISVGIPIFFFVCVWILDIFLSPTLYSNFFSTIPLYISNLLWGLCAVVIGTLAIEVAYYDSDISAERISLQVMSHLTLIMAFGLVLMYVSADASGSALIFAGLGIGVFLGLTISVAKLYRLIQPENMKVFRFGFVATILCLIVFISALVLSNEYAIQSLELLILGAIAASCLIAILRVDDWLISRVRWHYASDEECISVLPHVTPILFKPLKKLLNNRLIDNWEAGLQDCFTISQYTNQTKSVRRAISDILQDRSKTKEKALVKQCEQIWKEFSPSAANNNNDQPDMAAVLALNLPPDVSSFIPSLHVERTAALPKWLKFLRLWFQLEKKEPKPTLEEQRRKERMAELGRSRWRPKLSHKIMVNSPVAGAIGGYWYIEKAYPKDAESAFKEVDFSEFSKEMQNISQALEMLWQFEHIPDPSDIKLPTKPKNVEHGDTWDSLAQFKNVARQVWVLKHCKNFDKYLRAVDYAFVALDTLQENLPNFAEREILYQLSEDWRTETLQLVSQPLAQQKLKTIDNPFVTAEPLTVNTKSLLVGRKSALDQLNAAWTVGNFQPVLICGQHQSGKTSLLQITADSKMRLVLIKLRQLGIRSNSVHILQAICDEIQRQNIYRVAVSTEMSEDPYRVFSQYIKEVCLRLGKTGLVVGLDEFEFIEHNSNKHELRGLMSFLWSLSQSEPNLGVAFLTASTLPELGRIFDTPFTRYMKPIMLGFLTEKGVAQLLRNPTADFLPYCDDLAVRRIMELTAGQPYLVQLCGAFLFEWYNSEVRSDKEPSQDPLLTYLDVDQALASDNFHLQCERYYRGICDEAMRIDHDYAMPILKKIAGSQYDPNGDEILAQIPDRQRINMALSCLEAHSIIGQYPVDPPMPPRWSIKVPLFRDWLKNR